MRLTQSEVFRGILVPLLARSLHQNTQPQFAAMNKALAERVAALEAGAVAAHRDPPAFG